MTRIMVLCNSLFFVGFTKFSSTFSLCCVPPEHGRSWISTILCILSDLVNFVFSLSLQILVLPTIYNSSFFFFFLFYMPFPFRKWIVMVLHNFLSFVAHNKPCLFAISPIPPTICTSSIGRLIGYHLCPSFFYFLQIRRRNQFNKKELLISDHCLISLQ